MCGICGIVALQNTTRIEESILARMTDVLSHRGPDDRGLFIDNGIGLGFRRLSIVDLAGGHQPLANETGDTWVTFNGEIYNHKELRAILEKNGHSYRTHSDTETIVHSYEEYGLDAFKKFNGMFAIALWDGLKRRFVLVRDRLGIKPVYYYCDGKQLLYSSEIKSFLEHPDFRAACNEESLQELLSFRFIAGEQTIFRGVKSLLPGQFLLIENGELAIKTFWDLELQTLQADLSFDDAVTELESRLAQTTKLRLMADVPLGTLCSGGVDSSLTTAYAVEAGMSDINTFSVGFAEAAFDETIYAQMVSKRYATKHHQLVVTGEQFADLLPQLVWQNDEPLNHPNSVQIFCISEYARSLVTVLLTGEGADEIFGGYPRYFIPLIAQPFTHLPQIVNRPLQSAGNLSSNHKIHKLASSLGKSPADLLIENSAFTNFDAVADLLRHKNQDALAFRRATLDKAKAMSADLCQQLLYLELKTYLVSILQRMDKMTMAARVEGRVPFLDHTMVEWAATIPRRYKFSRFENKRIVKALGTRKLPREVVHRQKSGFGVPLDVWFRNKMMLGRYRALFNNPDAAIFEYLDRSRLRSVLHDHQSQISDNGELIWMATNFELWHRIFIQGESRENLAEILRPNL